MLKECSNCQGKGYVVRRSTKYEQKCHCLRWRTEVCLECYGRGFKK